MGTYITDGLMIFKMNIVAGIIVTIAFELTLVITKKRQFKDYDAGLLLQILLEFLLITYVCTILKVTGVLGQDFTFGLGEASLAYAFKIPFVGASIKMVILNFLLFVPYGALLRFVFRERTDSWTKYLMIGAASSLAIELFQAFTGRLPEIDDWIANTAGFMAGAVLAEGLVLLRRGDVRKGMARVIGAVCASVLCLFLVSFVADGDQIQAEENQYYNEIGSPEGTLDEEMSAMDSFTAFLGDEEDAAKSALNGNEVDGEYWYTIMGMDIANAAGHYVVEETAATFVRDGHTYFEISYKAPQTFRFYNNRDWVIKDATYLIYCIETGELWYGDDQAGTGYYAHYESSENPYEPDQELVNEVRGWLSQ